MSHAHVKEEMSQRAVSVRPSERLHQALSLMQRTGFRHLPVVDDTGMLAGMISDRDIFRRGVVRNDEVVMGNFKVESVMTKGVHTCRPGDRLGDIAEEMVRYRIDALPVVDDQARVIGIITSTDLLLYVRRIDGVLDIGALTESRIERDERGSEERDL